DSLVNLVHRVLRLPYESPTDRKDHCPVVYTFSRGGVRRLFRDFSSVEVHAEYPFTYGFGPLTTKLPLGVRRPLGRPVGRHLMLTARRWGAGCSGRAAAAASPGGRGPRGRGPAGPPGDARAGRGAGPRRPPRSRSSRTRSRPARSCA